MPLEASADSQCFGVSSTVAREWECGRPQKRSQPASVPGRRWGDRGGGGGFCRVLGTSAGAVTGSGAQAAPGVGGIGKSKGKKS